MKKCVLSVCRQACMTLLMSVIFLSMGINKLSAEGDDQTKDEEKKDPVIRIGWRAGLDKQVIGYRVEKFGWIGGEFSRIKPVYEMLPCCWYTGHEMDGCSAVRNCAT